MTLDTVLMAITLGVMLFEFIISMITVMQAAKSEAQEA